MPEIEPFFTHLEQQIILLLEQGTKPSHISTKLRLHPRNFRVQLLKLHLKVGSESTSELLSRVKLPTEILTRQFEERQTKHAPSAESIAAAAEAEREADLQFYRLLTPTRPDTACRRPGCTNLAIEHSVLCREHHFELIRHKPCPFQGDA